MTATVSDDHGLMVGCNFAAVVRRGPAQLPLFSRRIVDPGPRAHGHRTAMWQDIARALPANLGLETTDGRTWRIITVPHDMRRALEALDIYEGDVIPDQVMLERRRRVVEAELLVAQAKAVLRAVNTELHAEVRHLTGNPALASTDVGAAASELDDVHGQVA